MNDEISPKERRRKRQVQARKKEIIETARDLFHRQGFDQVSMDDIAEVVELSKVTIYKDMGTKDNLYYAVASQALSNLRALLQEVTGDQFQGLTSFGEAYLQFLDNYPKDAQFVDFAQLTIKTTQMMQRDPSIWSEYENAFVRELQLINTLLNEAISRYLEDQNIVSVNSTILVNIISNLGMIIKDQVLREKQEPSATVSSRQSLTLLFKILDQGVLHLDN